MEDITGLGKLAESKLVNQIYDDGLSKATHEMGDALSDVSKAFRLFLAPIQLLAVAQDRLSVFCDRIRSAVPEKRQIEAAPSIAAPILLELRYMEDENPITELYLNLLKCAIDRDRADDAHPAFAKIIGQLSPDEAMILHHLASNEIQMVEFRSTKTPDHPLISIARSDYPIHAVSTSRRFSMFLEHLEYLNLVNYGVGTAIDNDQFSVKEDQIAMGSTTKLTQFGRLFVAICEP